LRCSLLALWQWVWPRGCIAILQVQSWPSPPDGVMPMVESANGAAADQKVLIDLAHKVGEERKRQEWRGEMYKRKVATSVKDPNALNNPLEWLLPPIERDDAFRLGGWIASTGQQRRAGGLDGGTTVRSVNLRMKPSNA